MESWFVPAAGRGWGRVQIGPDLGRGGAAAAVAAVAANAVKECCYESEAGRQSGRYGVVLRPGRIALHG